ncbi:MAG: hypothetical protein V1782_01585 [Pseudomonadota bacterium]
MMIRITDTPKPRDKFGSIPIRDGKPTNRFSPVANPPHRSKPSSLWTWLKKIVGVFLGLLLLLVLGSPLLIPYLTTTFLTEQLAAALNRPVTIARGDFNPLTCTLTLHQLIIGPKLSKADDPVDPLLSAGRISIIFLPKRLLNREISCTLDAEHFFLHLVRQKDGGYNLGQALDDLLPGMPVFSLRFCCNTIAIGNSRLVFDDEQTGKTYLAEELALTISPGQTSPLGLQAKINGIPITLPDSANLTAIPTQLSDPPLVKPEPAGPGEDTGATDTPDDPAAKRAETIALVQNLSQASRQYLQNPVNQPVAHRTPFPLAP